MERTLAGEGAKKYRRLTTASGRKEARLLTASFARGTTDKNGKTVRGRLPLYYAASSRIPPPSPHHLRHRVQWRRTVHSTARPHASVLWRCPNGGAFLPRNPNRACGPLLSRTAATHGPPPAPFHHASDPLPPGRHRAASALPDRHYVHRRWASPRPTDNGLRRRPPPTVATQSPPPPPPSRSPMPPLPPSPQALPATTITTAATAATGRHLRAASAGAPRRATED